MAIDSPHYRMADRLAGGNLDAVLADYKRRGLSARQVCNRLYAEHGIEVTHPTAGKWLASVPDEPEAVAS
jgi:hypothetical protein